MSSGWSSNPRPCSSAPMRSSCRRVSRSGYSPANLPASRRPANDRARRNRKPAKRAPHRPPTASSRDQVLQRCLGRRGGPLEALVGALLRDR